MPTFPYSPNNYCPYMCRHKLVFTVLELGINDIICNILSFFFDLVSFAQHNTFAVHPFVACIGSFSFTAVY